MNYLPPHWIKWIDFLPQTRFLWTQYLCNLMVQTVDISNLDYFIYIINSLKYLRSTTLDYKDKEIRKSEFVAKTQLLWTIDSNFKSVVQIWTGMAVGSSATYLKFIKFSPWWILPYPRNKMLNASIWKLPLWISSSINVAQSFLN